MPVTDCRGIEVSNATQDMVDALDICHMQSLNFRGDPVGGITEVLNEHPDFVMGHCFKAGMLTQAMETRIYDEMVASVEAAEALADKANDRERGHIQAVRLWVDGDFFGAVQKWEEVLTHHPRDLLALQLVHLTDLLLGDIVGTRDSVARVFPLWDESMPAYDHVLAFYSFGLEENGAYGRAEEYGRRALALRPDHPYAVHAVAHVLEMQGRQAGGIWFMRERVSDWATSNFSNHLWWHLSLFHLDLGQVDQVLDIYDNHLRSANPDPAAEKYEELDSAALLWRLKLLDIDVGDRWQGLADKWERSATDTLYAFNDVHAMMTFVAAGRDKAAHRLLNANERYVRYANDANVAMSREIGLPFARALSAFGEGRYEACVDELLPVRYRTARLGGSFAQRDVIAWTLLEAAVRSGRTDLALMLANERCEMKPTSPQNWCTVARIHEARGERPLADRARAKAASVVELAA